MFQDLDATLRAILTDSAAPTDLRGAEVSFETPDRDFKPTQPTVNLFLHDVQENHELRDNAPLMERVGDQYVGHRPPMRVDCTYLATAWSNKTGGLKTEEEHRLLGLSLLWISRFPTIENNYLQGSLKTPPQLFPLPTMVAQMKEDRSMGQFWSALGISPRPAFSLTVTVAVQPFDEAEQYPVLKTVQIEAALVADLLFTGTVLDNTLKSVAGAQVIVAETDQKTTTDQAGHFSLGPLASGNYTVVVRIGGRIDTPVAVWHGIDSQVHDLVVPLP